MYSKYIFLVYIWINWINANINEGGLFYVHIVYHYLGIFIKAAILNNIWVLYEVSDDVAYNNNKI